jgi:E3 ubiquitin-protein ligase UBR7
MSDNQITAKSEQEVVQSVEESTENVLSMVDVLEEEKQLEEDANAVLGASDDTNCTYPHGYVHRQALYACHTCSEGVSSQGGPAGVCLACSLECHEGHQLYELYTKRLFRCDCGNEKFPADFKCKLFPDKSSRNIDNKYNHNFHGVYCTCSRPYPDPEDEVEDYMIQCVICEDWFHGRHLGTETPDADDYQEMICVSCMKMCDFLWPYTVLGDEVKVTADEMEASVDVCEDEKERATNGKSDAGKAQETGEIKSVADEDKPSDDSTGAASGVPISAVKGLTNSASDRVVSVKGDVTSSESDTVASSSALNDSVTCHLEELKKRDFQKHDGAMFWKQGWRSKLCGCDTCKQIYLDKDVSFLTDESDTITSYENRGKDECSSSRYEKGMQELSKMHRVQQVDLLHGFNDMKFELTQYLKKFAENGKVVREEDIKEFFGQMQAKKKQKVSVPFHCR